MVRALALVGIAVSLGCSHDGGGDGGLTPDQYASQAAGALCTYEVRCGLFADQPSCLAFGRFEIGSDFDALIAAGKVAFDPAAAQACLDATASTPCDETQMAARVPPDACAHVATGTGSAGDACEQNAECASGVCPVSNCMLACCPGTCSAAQAPAGAGEPCATRACDVGLTCATATQTCVTLAGSGAGCDLTSDCAYGLGCGGGVCKPLPLVGQPCPDGICAELGAICSPTDTCVMYGLPGDPCTTSEDCSPFATCDVADGDCADLPVTGATCTTECSDGSYCAIPDGSPTGTCTAPGSDGAPCTRDTQCANHYCNPSGTCETQPVCL